MRIVWTDKARQIRNDLILYIAEDNVDAALELDDKIDAAIMMLQEFPFSGKVGQVSGTRELVIHRHYVVVYEVNEDVLTILLVVHTSQKYPSD